MIILLQTNLTALLLFPVVCIILGWSMGHVAVVSLRKKLVANKAKIARGVGAVAGDIIRPDQLLEKIKDPKNLELARPIIEEHVDAFLSVKIQEKMPAIAMFIGGSTLTKLKDGLMEEIDTLLPEVIASYAENMSGGLDIPGKLSSYIIAISDDDFSRKINAAIGKELNYLRIIGVAIGAGCGVASGIIASAAFN